MSEFYTNNRQVIKDLKINTGSTGTPTWSSLCCASEISLNLETDSEDFYVFCDAIQRHIPTGMNVALNTTIKIDAQSAGVQHLLSVIQGALTTGAIATLQNVGIKFDLLTGYDTNALTYTSLTGEANIQFDELGGEAEGSAEVGVTFNINGTLTGGGSQ